MHIISFQESPKLSAKWLYCCMPLTTSLYTTTTVEWTCYSYIMYLKRGCVLIVKHLLIVFAVHCLMECIILAGLDHMSWLMMLSFSNFFIFIRFCFLWYYREGLVRSRFAPNLKHMWEYSKAALIGTSMQPWRSCNAVCKILRSVVWVRKRETSSTHTLLYYSNTRFFHHPWMCQCFFHIWLKPRPE